MREWSVSPRIFFFLFGFFYEEEEEEGGEETTSHVSRRAKEIKGLENARTGTGTGTVTDCDCVCFAVDWIGLDCIGFWVCIGFGFFRIAG